MEFKAGEPITITISGTWSLFDGWQFDKPLIDTTQPLGATLAFTWNENASRGLTLIDRPDDADEADESDGV